MSQPGYYRFPTLFQDQITFVSEDDLWTVSASGGTARRLTSGLGAIQYPSYSPDGRWLAFSGRDEGPLEVFLMPAEGGQPRRLTFLGTQSRVIGWKNPREIIFSSNAGQPFYADFRLFTISLDGGQPRRLPWGPGFSLSFGPQGACAIGRNAVDPARWKRYRGGTAGEILIDVSGTGHFRKLVKTGGNLAYPMFIGSRVFFLSDHEGVGNLYSCRPDGSEIRRHTHHEVFYVRHPASDGARIVYHAGADLYLFDPKRKQTERIAVDYHSPRTQLFRRFIDASVYLEDAHQHPQGHLLGLIVRGKPVTLGNWNGPVQQFGNAEGVRYRLFRWLKDGRRFVVCSDEPGEECLEVHTQDGSAPVKRLRAMPIGRPIELKVDPQSDRVALTNHRNELWLIDLEKQAHTHIATSRHAPLRGFDWSPDGKWLAYNESLSTHTSAIFLYDVVKKKKTQVTLPVLNDVQPTFDPDGKYLYFLSFREFDPVYDQLHFDLGFPRGIKPYLIVLSNENVSPFLPAPKPPAEPPKPAASDNKTAPKSKPPAPTPPVTRIDLDGITDRVLAFPVNDGIYTRLAAISGKVYFGTQPVQGTISQNWHDKPANGTIECYDLELQKLDPVVSGVSDFRVSPDRKWLLYRTGNRLRLVKAGEKPDEAAAREGPGRKSGWIDLGRIQISVNPQAEWRQMYREAWRLQRDHFWTEDLSQVDWEKIYRRYLPLLDRLGTRGEFSDLVWEMQGELGTSHAYEMGGDYRLAPNYGLGRLAIDTNWDEKLKGWKILALSRGDPWDERRSSPLLRPGINARPGDAIIAIGGRALSAHLTPDEALVNLANREVQVTILSKSQKKPRTVTVKTLADESASRYRDWVEQNRAFVHEKSQGRIGYVHIPDMGPRGYAEFHRSFIAEVDRDGLIVDVRFNGGGHVSQLLLEKLARRRLAYVQTRWFGTEPYPAESVAGPVIALTNENAGSDGDIFSHCFKLLKLGPLVGKRTWGGVIGIWPRNQLVDGGLTSQPEFSFWFTDVGWQVENYGTDPDIEVDFLPQDHAAGRDPQLERTVGEILRLLKQKPPRYPDLGKGRPKKPLPKLPR